MKYISLASALVFLASEASGKHPQVYYQLSSETEALLSGNYWHQGAHHDAPHHHTSNQSMIGSSLAGYDGPGGF